ncbi:MAG TPA: class I SAM-dependent methyltransferase [Gemmatimonadales bacterium]
MSIQMETARSVERKTGQLYGEFWHHYDDVLFTESVGLLERRWRANGEPPDFFQGKRCLDAGCGGGRYTIAMASMGAASVVGMDVSESGLADAALRAEAFGVDNVTFRQGSVLDLPFDDGEFDFVLCSGILHHTPGVERGLRELRRVLRPDGSLFLLFYGEGGLYWALNFLMRPVAEVLGHAEVDRCITAAGLPANRRRTVLDHLFCPILETYTPERVDFLLRETGFRSWRRWNEAQLDHEASPERLVEELRMYADLWKAGLAEASEDAAPLERRLAEASDVAVATGEELIDRGRRGLLSPEAVRRAVIGTGHVRLIAELR